MKINKLCPKCGIFNQMELQYDDGWQLQCLKCSKIIPWNDSEVPPELNKRQYQIASIQSPTDVHYSFSMYGYNFRKHKMVEDE